MTDSLLRLQLARERPGRLAWLRVQHYSPRLRVLAAVALAVLVLALESPRSQGLALLLACGLAVAAGLSLTALIKRLLIMESMLLLVLVTLPFTTPGPPWFQLGPLTATLPGGLAALGIVLKAHAVVLALLALVGTLESVTLGHTLAHLGVPDKLVHLMLFTVRYIRVLDSEYRRLRQAMRARAFVARSDRRTWLTFGWLLGMLLVRSLERAHRIMEAMKCRGFRGRFYLLDEQCWQRRDSFAGVVALGTGGLLLLLDSMP